jgi:hypothetical protein
MGTETPNPGGQPKQTAPGKPASRQPTDDNPGNDQNRNSEEGQETPRTGRDPSEPIEQYVSNDIPTDDDDDADDDDEDETGTIELPGEGGEGDRQDRSTAAGNP